MMRFSFRAAGVSVLCALLAGCAANASSESESSAAAAASGEDACSADTADAAVRRAGAAFVKGAFTTGKRVTNVRVGMAGIGVPGKNRALFFTNDLEEDSIPPGETITTHIAGRLVIAPDCRVVSSQMQAVIDADASTDATGGSCSADTDDANVRVAAADFVKNPFTTGKRVRNVRVGMVGIGEPGRPRTLYFQNDLEEDSIPPGETIRTAIAGVLQIAPDCTVTQNVEKDMQALVPAP
jgi:hypothetical protein